MHDSIVYSSKLKYSSKYIASIAIRIRIVVEVLIILGCIFTEGVIRI